MEKKRCTEKKDINKKTNGLSLDNNHLIGSMIKQDSQEYLESTLQMLKGARIKEIKKDSELVEDSNNFNLHACSEISLSINRYMNLMDLVANYRPIVFNNDNQIGYKLDLTSAQIIANGFRIIENSLNLLTRLGQN